MYGSNSEVDNQAFGLSVLAEGVGVDGWVFKLTAVDVCGMGLGFLGKGISVWGVSGSTTARMAEVTIKML